ncbi:MAG: hypothetical protein LN566_00730 [Rickettsia endosymbiont of Stiretrus anchorago]|nr:hypothetical protein [Rickettsia endosymbiont of Stiretrus anchorago]
MSHIIEAATKNLGILPVLLNHYSIKIEEEHIIKAFDNPLILECLLKHCTTRINESIIEKALNRPEILKLLMRSLFYSNRI